jgi:hypothetical protein
VILKWGGGSSYRAYYWWTLDSCQVRASGYYFYLPQLQARQTPAVAVFLQFTIARCAHQGTCTCLSFDDLRLSNIYLLIIAKPQMALHR